MIADMETWMKFLFPVVALTGCSGWSACWPREGSYCAGLIPCFRPVYHSVCWSKTNHPVYPASPRYIHLAAKKEMNFLVLYWLELFCLMENILCRIFLSIFFIVLLVLHSVTCNILILYFYSIYHVLHPNFYFMCLPKVFWGICIFGGGT